jgi:redox-sensitive bicupin YhaK (pirin superfamily)
MINVIPAASRYHADFGWLSTYWHFSFGDYHDPKNMNFSRLRVFNDDIVQGGGGFGLHPHRDMEIVAYVLDGALAHEDNVATAAPCRPAKCR